jgi:hypothetical protein
MMVGIVLSAEQVRTAPPAVRHWLEQQVAADFAPGPLGPPASRAELDPERIAACSLPEVLEIFERIRQDGLACRVFLEFGQEPVATLHPSPLYALDIAEIARDTGIADGNQLVACFNLINSALQVERADPDATLFAFDGDGRCYVHETTHRALHLLRRDLLAPRPARHVSFPVTCEPPYRCAADAGVDASASTPLT